MNKDSQRGPSRELTDDNTTLSSGAQDAAVARIRSLQQERTEYMLRGPLRTLDDNAQLLYRTACQLVGAANRARAMLLTVTPPANTMPECGLGNVVANLDETIGNAREVLLALSEPHWKPGKRREIDLVRPETEDGRDRP